jgi:hypothetical protein
MLFRQVGEGTFLRFQFVLADAPNNGVYPIPPEALSCPAPVLLEFPTVPIARLDTSEACQEYSET